jgi:hypothetical protein
VATAADRYLDAVLVRKLQRELDVAGVRAASDRAGSAIDRTVPHAPQLLEFIGVGTDDHATQSRS